MAHDSSWKASAQQYLSLYRGLIRNVGSCKINKADPAAVSGWHKLSGLST
jgi:hypothetical protein